MASAGLRGFISIVRKLIQNLVVKAHQRDSGGDANIHYPRCFCGLAAWKFNDWRLKSILIGGDLGAMPYAND